MTSYLRMLGAQKSPYVSSPCSRERFIKILTRPRIQVCLYYCEQAYKEVLLVFEGNLDRRLPTVPNRLESPGCLLAS